MVASMEVLEIIQSIIRTIAIYGALGFAISHYRDRQYQRSVTLLLFAAVIIFWDMQAQLKFYFEMWRDK
jgi:hypothetical protein